MSHVFISYRRDDAAGHAARIAERLRERLGDDRVFFDEDSIQDGADWEAAIAERMGATTLLVAVIGARWFDAERRARLERPDDKLRQEIATALKTKTRVLPVLVDGAKMPPADDLPDDIRGLTKFQALPLPEQYFDQGINRIVRSLGRPWGKWAAIGGAAAALALLAWLLVPRVVDRRSTYVVQVFETLDGRTVEAVKVRVKSLPSDEQDTQVTDDEGLARFRLQNDSILALGLEYTESSGCIGARLPAFAAPELPAVTPVYLDAIPPRVKGACGDTGSSDVSRMSSVTRSLAVTTLPAPPPGDMQVSPGPAASAGRSATSAGRGGLTPPLAGRAGVRPPPPVPTTVDAEAAWRQLHLPWGAPAAPLVVTRRPYVVGFDPALKLARWVAYKVANTAPRPRQRDAYAADPSIAATSQAVPSAYRDNPYDRGNFVRRLDVGESDEAAAFYMSVIAPQADRMNQGVWTRIEDLASRAATGAEVWVLTGPAFLPAPGKTDIVYPVLEGGVAVPTHWFRVAVRRSPQGPLDSISFLVPNTFTVQDNPSAYLTSIADIERATGLVLLSGLPVEDRARLKNRRATALW